MSYTVAVVGATGNVGREMLSILAERLFPATEVHALASRRSVGVEVSFGDQTLKCKDLATFDFSKVDFCLMSAGGSVSKEWSPKIAAKGCIVIDNSSAWRYDQAMECGVDANAAKHLAGEAAFRACETAVMTHGGMGYSKEFHVERYLREVLITRIAPVTPHMILNFIAEKALGLPKSY